MALWLESWSAPLEHLPVAGLFPRLCVGHMARACSVCPPRAALDLFDCSIWAHLHTGIPWKHRLILQDRGKTKQALRISSQISFVFPSFMGKD